MLFHFLNEKKEKKNKRKEEETQADMRTDRWIIQLRGENRTCAVCLLVVSVNIFFGVTLQANVRIETRIDKCFVKLERIMESWKRSLNQYQVK